MLQLAALRFVQPLACLRSSSYLPITKVSIDLHDTRTKESKRHNALDQLAKEVMKPQPAISRIKRARLGDDADIASSGARVLSELQEVTGAGAGRRAKKRGHSLNQQQQADAARRVAATKLFNELPSPVVQGLGGWTDSTFQTLAPSKLQKFIEAWCQTWEPGTIDNARLAWCRLRTWMDRSDIIVDYPCIANLVEYFQNVHERAVADASSRHSQRCMIATLRGHPAPVFRRDGTKAALGQWTGLEFLRRNLRMPIPTLETKKMLPQRMGIIPRCVRRHARPLSMRMLVDIERFITSVNCPPVLRNVGGGILFMAYACFRWKQTGSIQLYFIVDGCLCGQVDVDKGTRKEPRPFFLPITGLVSGRRWFKVLLRSLQPDGRHIFRDFEGPIDSIEPSFLPAPLPSGKWKWSFANCSDELPLGWPHQIPPSLQGIVPVMCFLRPVRLGIRLWNGRLRLGVGAGAACTGKA